MASMGLGKAQWGPGRSNACSPSPTGLPKRKMIALSCGATVKNPELRNARTSTTMMIWTMKKLPRNASDSACEPASSAGGTWPGGGV